MRTSILVVICLLVSPFVKAQESYNRVTLAFESRHATYAHDPTGVTKGLSVGYVRGLSINESKPFFIEAGSKLQWTHAVSTSWPDEYDVTRWDFLSVAFPINATYQFCLFKDNFRLVPLTGPNFRFNLIGRRQEVIGEKENRTYNSSNLLARDIYSPAKIFQFGWNLGLYISHGRLSFCYMLTYDFTPYANTSLYDYGAIEGGTVKTASHSLAVAFSF